MRVQKLLCLILAFTVCLARSGASWASATPDGRETGWEDLVIRLKNDGLYNNTIAEGIRALPPPNPAPMSRKVKELYLARFARPCLPPPDAPKPKPVYVYPKVVTPENTAICRTFLNEHREAFKKMENGYGVPGDIAVALLFVETRLGTSPGKSNVFHTLASMAETRRLGQLGTWLNGLNPPQSRLDWLQETMRLRSDRAYKELTAFIRYAEKNGIDPFSVPGSIYGAFGICQFIPSSVAPYAADGNGDGVIDLFALEDALASLASYLVKHGWKTGLSRADRHAVLRRYNRLDIYANTILALADTVRSEPVGKPVVTVGRHGAGLKTRKTPGKK
ncbi:MAG: lytic murein transglycosylase [Desulfovibrio sp.]|jgi:membrane-bound lytic murein transglycosylase B|nr:lytic murein transglycosylase [Desulfovibrio sp.]